MAFSKSMATQMNTQTPVKKLAVEERSTAVQASDLEQLDVLHSILRILNEPAASATAIANLVEKLPVLSLRVRERYSKRTGKSASASAALAVLGNRVFEGLLLELLEDLTVLRSDIDANNEPPIDSVL